MSKRYYPYLSNDEKYKTPKKCDKCGNNAPGHRLTWQVSWFRGDDEIEDFCNNCYSIEIEKIRNEEEKKLKKEREKEQIKADFFGTLLKMIMEKYSVDVLSTTQWRVNGVVDVYPVNRRFHDIKNNKRGSYKDINIFLRDFFESGYEIN